MKPEDINIDIIRRLRYMGDDFKAEHLLDKYNKYREEQREKDRQEKKVMDQAAYYYTRAIKEHEEQND